MYSYLKVKEFLRQTRLHVQYGPYLYGAGSRNIISMVQRLIIVHVNTDNSFYSTSYFDVEFIKCVSTKGGYGPERL